MPGLRNSVTRERLAGLHAHLALDAREPRRIDLGLRDADHVLVGHAHARDAAPSRREAGRRRRPSRRHRESAQPIEIKPRVVEILIGGEPAHAFGRKCARRLRHRRDLRFEIGERRRRPLAHVSPAERAAARPPSARPPARHGSRAGCSRPPCRRRGSPPRTPRPESAARPLPAMTPSITALIMAPLRARSLPCRAAAIAREFFSIACDQPLLIVAAVAHRHLLDHQIGAAGRGDRRACGRA